MKDSAKLWQKEDWVLLGPLGPALPASLSSYPLITVDGGANFASRSTIWIGDGDSLSQTPVADELRNLPRDKDHSDLAAALGLFPLGKHCLHLWGFLGGRRDHELFVLGECLSFLKHRPETKIILYQSQGQKTFELLGPGTWPFTHQGLFSLGTLQETAVHLEGQIQYPLNGKTRLRPLSSHGLSNQASGSFTLTSDAPLFIYWGESL